MQESLRDTSKKISYLFTMQAVFDNKPQGNTSLLFKERWKLLLSVQKLVERWLARTEIRDPGFLQVQMQLLCNFPHHFSVAHAFAVLLAPGELAPVWKKRRGFADAM